MTGSRLRIAAKTRTALPLAAIPGLFLGACAQAPPARVLDPLPHTTATLVDATSPAAVRADRLLSGLEAIGFSGAIIVEERGRVVLRKGYGLADRAARLPYTPATVQDMASITKPFTAAAILLLEQRGALSVDDPITRFFEGVPAEKREITLHHLLTHTSGFTGGLGSDEDPIGADALLAMALASPLAFEPAARWGYSNTGFSLLGMVIERVSGRGYEEFVREELLLPLGMRSTGYLLGEWPESALAYGYVRGDLYGRALGREWRSDGPGWHLRANGGLHTTVGDMHRWLGMLRGEGPLSATQVERWTTPRVDPWGYGWEVREMPKVGRLIGHSGDNAGVFGADFVWLPEHEIFYYVQSNSSVVSAPYFRREIVGALLDADAPIPPVVQAEPDLDPAVAVARAGLYRVGGSTLRAVADDVRLVITVEGQEAIDAFLDHTAEERHDLAALNAQTEGVIAAVLAGRDDALTGLVPEGSDPAEQARALRGSLERSGQLRSATVLGSARNAPGTQFDARGGSLTLVRLELPTGQVGLMGMIWSDAGHFLSAARNPFITRPAFVLVPRAGGGYSAVERTAPWRTREVAFEGGCLVAGEMRACPDTSRER